MSKFLIAFLILTSVLSAPTALGDAAGKSLKILRALEVQERDQKGKWVSVGEEGSKVETVELALRPFHKGGGKGITDKASQAVRAGTLFRSEIRISALESEPNKYYVYTMLRSGPTLKRNGKIKTAYIQDEGDFSPLVLEDAPIEVGGRTLRARLTVRPVK